jgi:membrane-anchored mycosin MYCP
MTAVKGRIETFRDDQIVVALADLDVVTREIEALHARTEQPVPHEGLGLTLLPLDGTSIVTAIDELGRDGAIAAELAAFTTARKAESNGRISPLDELLKGLRLRFARKYDNWQPTFGKNRTISKIAGSPHVGGGGVGPPKETRDFLAPRETSPEQHRTARIGLLDTRMFHHNWLAGGYLARPGDLLREQAEYRSTQAHATSVASCILDRAPGAQVHLRRVLDDNATGDSWAVATAMVEIADAGFDVVNLSFGEYFTDDGEPPLVIDTAVKLLSARTVVVAAAGNHGNVASRPADEVPPGLTEKSPSYPAALPNVLAVGALEDAKPAPFSPKDAPWIRLMAPGVDLTVAYLSGQVLVASEDGTFRDAVKLPFSGWAKCSGTSYAAGSVTGEIANQMIKSGVTARQAAEHLLSLPPGQPQSGIRPADWDR